MDTTPTESFPETLKRRGVNVTDDNVLAVHAVLRKHGVRDEKALNKLHRGILAKKALLKTIPPLVGGAAALAGGPVLGAAASVATSSALSTSDQPTSRKSRIRSVGASVAASFINAEAAQPLVEAGAQFLTQSDAALSHDISWLDGKNIPRINSIVTSYNKPYSQQALSVLHGFTNLLTKPQTFINALGKAAGEFAEAYLPHSSSVVEGLTSGALSNGTLSKISSSDEGKSASSSVQSLQLHALDLASQASSEPPIRQTRSRGSSVSSVRPNPPQSFGR
jgi:hypothetical protein